MNFLRRAISALRQVFRTLSSKIRRTARAVVRGVSSAALATSEAIQTSRAQVSGVVKNVLTASADAVRKARKVVGETAHKVEVVMKKTAREAQKIAVNTGRQVRNNVNYGISKVRSAWNWWNTSVPRWVRLAIYGAAIGAGIGALAYVLLGFGPAGVVAGSPAAAWHSSIGIVSKGHLFATLQSLGATGKLAWIMPSIGGSIGALVAQFF